MRFRVKRLAKGRWRGLKRAWRRRVAKHPRAIAVFVLVLVAGGLGLALLPARDKEKSLGLSVSRPIAITEKPLQLPKPVEEAARRPPPPLPPAGTSRPAWLRYAVPAPPTGDRPLVAVVLDDLGLDRARTAEAIGLRGPLTLSFMTYASELGEQTEAAHRAGHELFLHVPMEAVDRHADPGLHGLLTSQSRDEILDRLRWGLGRFDGFVGINNHMGSKFTSDARSMAPVMEELRTRGLVFLDSRTSPASSGIRQAIATAFRTSPATCSSTTSRHPLLSPSSSPRLSEWRDSMAARSPSGIRTTRRSRLSGRGCRSWAGTGSALFRSARWCAAVWRRRARGAAEDRQPLCGRTGSMMLRLRR